MMKKMIAIFFASSFLFGIAMAIMFWDIAAGIVSGFFFGGFLVLIIGLLHYMRVKDMGGKKASSSVKQEKEIEVPLSLQEAFKLCKISFYSFGGSEITEENREAGIIKGKTKSSMWSWGEKITFHIRKIDEEACKILIQSKPSVSTAMIDYGQNLKNVNAISELLLRGIEKSEIK